MAGIGIAKANDFTVIPAGTYRVKITSVKPTEPHPEYGPGLEWAFDLIDPEDAELAAELRDAGERFTARTGLVAGPNSKARKWVESIIGRPLDEKAEEQANDDMVVGQIVDALVTNKPNQKGVTRHYVETLVPVKKAKRPEPAPAPTEDEAEEPF